MSVRKFNVVGAVIVEEGQVLCARRGTGALAGLWEFPGGKVEPGESPQDALVREIAEELHCSVVVGAEVTTTNHAYDFGAVTLTTFYCELASGTPMLTEHTELTWLAPADLGQLDWAPADVPAIEIIRRDHA